MVQEGLVEYVKFPDALRGKYQCFTQSDVSRLRAAGYDDRSSPCRKASAVTASGCWSEAPEVRLRGRSSSPVA
jgi:hypothetical protein